MRLKRERREKTRRAEEKCDRRQSILVCGNIDRWTKRMHDGVERKNGTAIDVRAFVHHPSNVFARRAGYVHSDFFPMSQHKVRPKGEGGREIHRGTMVVVVRRLNYNPRSTRVYTTDVKITPTKTHSLLTATILMSLTHVRRRMTSMGHSQSTRLSTTKIAVYKRKPQKKSFLFLKSRRSSSLARF